MDAREEINRLLKEDHAMRYSEKRHYKYRLSTGAVFVQAKTPSDHRSGRNDLARLRRLLKKETIDITSKSAKELPMIETPKTTPEPPKPPAPPTPTPAPVAVASPGTRLRQMNAEDEKVRAGLYAQIEEVEHRIAKRTRLIEALDGLEADDGTMAALLGVQRKAEPGKRPRTTPEAIFDAIKALPMPEFSHKDVMAAFPGIGAGQIKKHLTALVAAKKLAVVHQGRLGSHQPSTYKLKTTPIRTQ